MKAGKVTAIIPSAGYENRISSLFEAIESLQKQARVDVHILVVLNGPNVAHGLKEKLELLDDVSVQQLSEPSLPRAIQFGRSCVTTDYFCFLDDDDLYVPNTLHLRSQILDACPETDVVATNGFINHGDRKTLALPTSLALDVEPMQELFRQNWLASCGGLFRASSVKSAYFHVSVKYFEWTMTAFLLSLDRNITYLNEPTFEVRKTEGSLSSSEEYLKAAPAFFAHLSSYSVPDTVRSIIAQRYASSLHNLASYCANNGRLKEAWKYHLLCLARVQGWKYLSFTRHLLSVP